MSVACYVSNSLNVYCYICDKNHKGNFNFDVASMLEVKN